MEWSGVVSFGVWHRRVGRSFFIIIFLMHFLHLAVHLHLIFEVAPFLLVGVVEKKVHAMRATRRYRRFATGRW